MKTAETYSKRLYGGDFGAFEDPDWAAKPLEGQEEGRERPLEELSTEKSRKIAAFIKNGC